MDLLSTLWKFSTWTALCETVEEIYTCNADEWYMWITSSEIISAERQWEEILFREPPQFCNWSALARKSPRSAVMESLSTALNLSLLTALCRARSTCNVKQATTSLQRNTPRVNMEHMFKNGIFSNFLCIIDWPMSVYYQLGMSFRRYEFPGDLVGLLWRQTAISQLLDVSPMPREVNSQSRQKSRTQSWRSRILTSGLCYAKLSESFACVF